MFSVIPEYIRLLAVGMVAIFIVFYVAVNWKAFSPLYLCVFCTTSFIEVYALVRNPISLLYVAALTMLAKCMFFYSRGDEKRIKDYFPGPLEPHSGLWYYANSMAALCFVYALQFLSMLNLSA